MAVCKRTVILFGVLTFASCISAAPQKESEVITRRPRQDDDDDATPAVNFGAQVAQIITGAFTGNLDSIIKGSFGFIQDPDVNKLSHNTWNNIKSPWVGTTSTKKPVALTKAPTEPMEAPAPPKRRLTTAAPILEEDPETPAPPPKKRRPPPAPVTEESFVAAEASASQKEPVPDVYYPGSPDYPTKAPVRTTQPTYPTLAPLQVDEDTKESIIISTTEEDDEEEGEGLSFENENAARKS